jgi:hypothetical protein
VEVDLDVPKPIPPSPLDAKTARLRAARLARDAALPKTEREDSHYRVLGLHDAMPFGKFKGKTIDGLIDEDIGYVTWLLSDTKVELSTEAEAEYQSRLDPRRPRGVWVDE